MTERKESGEYTVYEKYIVLDGVTVKDLRRMLDDYPDDAVIDVRSEKVYDIDGGRDQDREFFVIRWEE
jgi:hypothetical protein